MQSESMPYSLYFSKLEGYYLHVIS